MKGKVQTVLGLIDPDYMGVTLTHEHLLHDIPLDLFQKPVPHFIPYTIDSPVVLENLGWVRQYPYCFRDNRIFSEKVVGEYVKEEMNFFKKCGGSTIVDNGSIGVRSKTQSKYLEKLSMESGINIILGTGFYVAKSQSPHILSMSQEDMEQKIREEILSGVDGTNVKCGVIGEIGCSWPLLPFEKLSLISSAVVQEETGCPVTIHPGRNPKAPEEILRIYLEAGGKAERLVMGHLDRTFSSMDQLLEFASLGTFCEFDLFGIEVSHYLHDEGFDMPSDAQRIRQIRALVEEGYGEKIVVSHDIHTKHRLGKYGGHGYSHILLNIVPKMLNRGLTHENIHNFLTENPKKWLTFSNDAN